MQKTGTRRFSGASPYEESCSFSRAVRHGPWLSVAGTAPIAEGGAVACPGDLHGQTLHCLSLIRRAIEGAGLELADTVRTRIMVTDIERWEEAGRAHGEFFGDIRPACTMVEVSALIDPGWLVEIEADCYRQE